MGRAVVRPPARPSAKAVSAGRKLSGLPAATLANPSPAPGLPGGKGDQGIEGATGAKGETGESFISGGRKHGDGVSEWVSVPTAETNKGALTPLS